MKLDYSQLVSNNSVYIPNIAHIRHLTIQDIWDYDTVYDHFGSYQIALWRLSWDIKDHFEFNQSVRDYFDSDDGLEIYNYLKENGIDDFKIYDFWVLTDNGATQLINALSVFIEDVMKFDSESRSIVTYNKSDDTKPVGIINRFNFDDLCNVIFQMNCINIDRKRKASTKKKSKALEKLEQHPDKIKERERIEKMNSLPNIISAVCANHPSINYINVSQLTVYQLRDNFERLYNNVFFEIKKMQVAAYGNEDDTFKYDMWCENIND